MTDLAKGIQAKRNLGSRYFTRVRRKVTVSDCAASLSGESAQYAVSCQPPIGNNCSMSVLA